MHVDGLGGGRVELDDGREADFADGRGHVHVEAPEIQAPVAFTFCLKRETCCLISTV